MSIAHPSGNDLESMSEFYNNFFLRAVTLVINNEPIYAYMSCSMAIAGGLRVARL